MPEEETASSSKTANVLRISLPDRLSRLLQAFASRPDAAFGEQNEDDDEVRSEGADEIAAGAEPVNSLSPKWTVGAVDVGAWLAWELVGLRLLSGNRLPNMQAFSTAARWVLLIAAIERFDGNITRMAEALGTSRRALRGQLKAAGLYVDRTPPTEVPVEREPPEARDPNNEEDGERVKKLW